MKAISILCLVGAAIAGPVPSVLLEPRQGKAAILTGLANIGKAIDATTLMVNKWDGKAGTFDAILTSSNAIAKEIQSATTAINSAPEVGLLEATSVIAPANTLDGKVQSVTSALVAKKSGFQSIGKAADVKQNLVEQKNNAQALAKAIVAKMPALAGPVAEPLAQGFVTKLEAAVMAYS
jgi:hypothetical protein